MEQNGKDIMMCGPSIVEVKGKHSSEWECLSEDDYSFLLCTHGVLSVRENSRLYSVKKGSILFCVPNNKVGWRCDVNSDFVLFKVSKKFFGEFLLTGENLISLQKARLTPVVELDSQEYTKLLKVMDSVKYIIEDADNSTCGVNAYVSAVKMLWHLIFKSLMRVNAKDIHYQEGVSCREIDLCSRFMELLYLNYRTIHSINFYASKLCITPHYLSMVVKNITSISPRDWVQNVLIEDAMCDLKFTNKTIKEIALSYNFSDQSAFGKFFKRMTGLSPLEYRRRYYRDAVKDI